LNGSRYGGIPVTVKQDAVAAVRDATGGRGVDIAIEAAWVDETVQQAVEMLRMGGLLVQGLGGPLAILLDGLSFLVSASSLSLIGRREPPERRPGGRSGPVDGACRDSM
jgi:D-arabinose 1-dehydrogenase-like Zn-dependent alcohol dehydrogenase